MNACLSLLVNNFFFSFTLLSLSCAIILLLQRRSSSLDISRARAVKATTLKKN